MIRTNTGLNCACANNEDCPNGRDYCNMKDSYTGRTFCKSIGKVEPIDVQRLDSAIEYYNLMRAVSQMANKTIAREVIVEHQNSLRVETRRDTRNDRTLSLFTNTDNLPAHGGKEYNSPAHIAELCEIAMTVKTAMLGFRASKPIATSLPRKMTDAELSREIRCLEYFASYEKTQTDLVNAAREIPAAIRYFISDAIAEMADEWNAGPDNETFFLAFEQSAFNTITD